MNIVQSNKKNIIELNTKLSSYLREQFNLKLQHSSGKLKKTHLLKIVRKNIARVYTVIAEYRKQHHNE
ncbi:50S ribosomal protein L29 [Buchnera aphidicola (Thelaxes suberi)]|uniref:50S ribosomal protein L29 n=1 Tax=Buchnera aphidicola TaxID=9 RepID=UPI003464C9BB